MGTGMEVMVVMHAGQSHKDWSHVRRSQRTFRVRGGDTADTRSRCLLGAQLWVGSSQNWSVFRGRP